MARQVLQQSGRVQALWVQPIHDPLTTSLAVMPVEVLPVLAASDMVAVPEAAAHS